MLASLDFDFTSDEVEAMVIERFAQRKSAIAMDHMEQRVVLSITPTTGRAGRAGRAGGTQTRMRRWHLWHHWALWPLCASLLTHCNPACKPAGRA